MNWRRKPAPDHGDSPAQEPHYPTIIDEQLTVATPDVAMGMVVVGTLRAEAVPAADKAEWQAMNTRTALGFIPGNVSSSN